MTANTRLLIHHQSHLSSPSGESENHFHGSDDAENTALQNLPFTKKLFDMLSDSDNTEMIVWNRDGLSFEVLDPKGLERDVLPKYFRHSRFQSLVRQLNFYNFKKVGKERSSWIYTHDYFQRDRPDLLDCLKRKTNTSAFLAMESELEKKRMLQQQSNGGSSVSLSDKTCPSAGSRFLSLSLRRRGTRTVGPRGRPSLSRPRSDSLSPSEAETGVDSLSHSDSDGERDSLSYDDEIEREKERERESARERERLRREERERLRALRVKVPLIIGGTNSRTDMEREREWKDLLSVSPSLSVSLSEKNSDSFGGDSPVCVSDCLSPSLSHSPAFPLTPIETHERTSTTTPIGLVSKTRLSLVLRTFSENAFPSYLPGAMSLSIEEVLVFLSELRDWIVRQATVNKRGRRVLEEKLVTLIVDRLCATPSLSASLSLLAREVVLYMEACGYPVRQLPYFKQANAIPISLSPKASRTPSLSPSMSESLLDALQKRQFEVEQRRTAMQSVFDGELSSEQMKAIVSHFLRFALNLLDELKDSLSESMSLGSLSPVNGESVDDVVDVAEVFATIESCSLAFSRYFPSNGPCELPYSVSPNIVM